MRSYAGGSIHEILYSSVNSFNDLELLHTGRLVIKGGLQTVSWPSICYLLLPLFNCCTNLPAFRKTEHGYDIDNTAPLLDRQSGGRSDTLVAFFIWLHLVK